MNGRKAVNLNISEGHTSRGYGFPVVSDGLSVIDGANRTVDLQDILSFEEMEQSALSAYEERDNEYFEAIREIVDDIASVLDNPIPIIKYLSSGDMPTPTTTAAITNTGLEILLNKDFYNPNVSIGPNHVYSLAHAVRMNWQHRNGRLNLHKVKSSRQCSIEEYNSQDFQIDAHAFAYLYLLAFYDEDQYEEVDDFFLWFMSIISPDTELWKDVFDRAHSITREEPDLFND